MAKAKDKKAKDTKSKDKSKAKVDPAKAAGAKGKKGKKGGKAANAMAAVKLAKDGETKASPGTEPRLKTRYEKEIAAKLQKDLGIKNKMDVPRLKKIVINCAVKEAVGNPKVLDNAMADLMLIAGQKPTLTRAKKSIATFKVREGMPLGVRVTLRKARMWEFLDRLVNVTIPRVRDFRGISSKAFDGRGNYSLGLKEQIIFPEIVYDQVDSIRGMSITMVTTAKDNEGARALLTEMGMPFRK